MANSGHIEFIRPFEKISKKDVGLAGGKGASLGEMTQAGIPVPPGFVILSETFDYFIEKSKVNDKINEILSTVNTEKTESVEKASDEIRKLILSYEIPTEIEEKIKEHFKKLNAEFVAVRSSATAEDSSSAAWAGQLESYLNTTEDNLIENVRKCWASLFTPRAVFYRFEKKLEKSKISVAVVVQKMVNSEESGIAFTVHPVTEDRNQMLIEACFGLGEMIVSGQITPDSYVVDKEKMSIIEKQDSYKKKKMIRNSQGKNEIKELDEEEGSKPVLNDEEIIELAKIILRIENHYGFPCDIEWAKENKRFYIVQSRPITTLGK